MELVLPRREGASTAAAAGMTVTLWASAFVGIRAARGDFAPGALALGRLLISCVALGALALRRREPLPGRRELPLIAVCGILWFGLYSLALTLDRQQSVEQLCSRADETPANPRQTDRGRKPLNCWPAGVGSVGAHSGRFSVQSAAVCSLTQVLSRQSVALLACTIYEPSSPRRQSRRLSALPRQAAPGYAPDDSAVSSYN
jgi:hypothetical protein